MDTRAGIVGSSLLIAACLAYGCSGGDGDAEICDATVLSAKLGAAHSGDTVGAGACRITGAFTVPAGVTLQGRGVGVTVLVGTGAAPVVTLSPGATPARLSQLSIEVPGRAGFVASGAGDVAIDHVAVSSPNTCVRMDEEGRTVLRGCPSGAGATLSGLTRATLDEVRFEGIITPDSFESQYFSIDHIPDTGTTTDNDPEPDEVPAYGLVLHHVQDAALTNVHAKGFARAGILSWLSGLAWQGGDASGNQAVGLLVVGGRATLRMVSLCDTIPGVRLPPAYGGVTAGDAVVDTHDLTVCNNGVGMLHAASTVTHENLLAMQNHEPAVWVQTTQSFTMMGGQITESGFAGVYLAGTGDVTMVDTHIVMTNELLRVYGETGSVRVGDGVQLVTPLPTGHTSLTGLRLDGNARIGLLVDDGDAPGATADVTLADVTVDAQGTSLGALRQGAGGVEPLPVERLGATAANDMAFHGHLDTLRIDGPDQLPSPLDDAAGLSSIGL